MHFGIRNKILLRPMRKSYCFCFHRNNSCINDLFKFSKSNGNRCVEFFVKTKSPKKLTHLSTFLNSNFQRNLSTKSETYTDDQLDLKPAESLVNNSDLPVTTLLNDISESHLIKLAEQILLQIHADTGLPWWATITVTAFLMRISITFPFAVTQVKLFTRLQAVSVELEEITKKLKIEINQAQKTIGLPKYSVDEKLENAIIKEQNALLLREKCHPMKTCVLIVLQVPLWLSFTFATRKLCLPPAAGGTSEGAYTEILNENFGWLTSLTSTDPYFIFPISIALVNLILIEVHQNNVLNQRKGSEQVKTIASRALSLSLIPVAAVMPVATNIYWLSSSTYGLLQAIFLYSKTSRKFFNIPKLKKKNF